MSNFNLSHYGYGGYPVTYDPSGIIANASNGRPVGNNATFTVEDFFKFYPHFRGTVEPFLVTQFIGMADTTVSESRWGASWTFGMGLFVAHFATLYLQTMTPTPDATAAQVVTAAQSRGLQTSKSVGDISTGYDYSVMTQAVDGWGLFKATQYGQQFASMARMLGKGGFAVW